MICRVPPSTSKDVRWPRTAVRRRTILRAVVTSEGRPLTQGVVDFTVDGTGAGRMALDSRGFATTAFATHLPGTYEVRARFSGTFKHEPSSSQIQTLNVMQR